MADTAVATQNNSSANEQKIDELASSESHSSATKRRKPPVPVEHPLSDFSPNQALHTFVRGFSAAFAVREGITLALRGLDVARRKGVRKLFSFERLLSEKGSVNRVDAVRLGLFVGGFTGGYKLLYWTLCKYLGPDWRRWSSLISGSAMGLCLLFQERSVRRIIALYAMTRLLQCIYNELKERKYFDFWWTGAWGKQGENVGDSILFILTSAQVMYAYVMRHDTLPPSYYKFIQRSGPIAEVVLDAVRKNCRGLPIDPVKIGEYCVKKGGINPNLTAFPSIIPCQVLHPGSSSCTAFCIKEFLATARKTLPIYATLTFVPVFVLQFRRLLRTPLQILFRSTVSWLRSTIFLATFVFLYQAVICIQRKMVTRDHKVIYYLAGLVSSCAILIEKKSRRSELALYVLPRAVDSLYTLLLDRKWMAHVPHFEVALFCVAMGGLMHFYQHGPATMSPALHYAFNWLLTPKKYPPATQDQEERKPARQNGTQD